MSDLTEKRCCTCGLYQPRASFHKDSIKRDKLHNKCKQCLKDTFKKFKVGGGYAAMLTQQKVARCLRRSANPIKLWAQGTASRCKTKSNKAGTTCDIDAKWLIANAPVTCPLLEVELVYDNMKSSDNSASVDRRDSSKGYSQDNCSIISVKANRIKSNATRHEIELLTNNLRTYLI